MNRLIVLGLAASFGAANIAMRIAMADPPVNLQAVTPGTAQSGHLNISGTATVGQLKSQGTVYGASTAPTGFAYGGFFTVASNQGRGFYGYASSPTGLTYGGFFQNASSQGRAVYALATATSGFNYGGYFQSASTGGRGLLGVAAAATGTTYGVYGTAVSPNGYGVFSNGNMAASGVISGNGSGLTSVNAALLGGQSASAFLTAVPNPLNLNGSSEYVIRAANSSAATDSTGIWGISNSVNGITYGGRFDNYSDSGFGVIGLSNATSGSTYGMYGRASSSSGRGVFGWATADSGTTYGVHGQSDSPNGVGVFGEVTDGSGLSYGVYGRSASIGGTGLYGYANATSGFTYGVIGATSSTSGRGVWAVAHAVSGVTYGLKGTTGSSAGFGVFSDGNMGASGTKPFRIDHPFDPENKYLLHYAAESPMPQNFYVGNIVTDAKGYAWVQLPDYFAEINTNFKYQLTVISGGEGFVQAMVSKEIHGNQFQVRTSAPNIKVSWRVDADRNDLFVRNRPPKDVIDKEGPEKGTYQHPEFYGLGPERGMNYRPERELERTRPPVEPSSKARSQR